MLCASNVSMSVETTCGRLFTTGSGWLPSCWPVCLAVLIAVSFVNYLDELPYFADEVLPRLVKLGVREPGRMG